MLLVAAPASAQAPTETAPTEPSPTEVLPEPTPETVTIPTVQFPGVLFPPFTGLDILSAPAAQGPLVVTPGFTLSEEFDDNIFQDNDNKEWDFITQMTPSLRLDVRRPGFQLGAGYSLTAEVYARNTELSDAVNRQNLFATMFYQATPRLSLTLTDTLRYDQTSNAAAVEGISTGRRETWSNVFAPGLRYQVTQRLGWRLYGAYELLRFGEEDSQDSDTYRAGTGFDYAVTPRLSFTTGYDFAYIDIEDEPEAYTHTPRFGFSYQVTPTLTAALSGGPSFLVSDGETSVSPGVTASLVQLQRWGSLSLAYDRAVRTSGGLGGASDVQSILGSVAVTTLVRGLSVAFTPRYTISESEDVAERGSEVKALTLNLSARYQIARYIALVGAYTFFNQRTDNETSTRGNDVDQNRVTLGLQFAYPISFD
jgi:hypothetical protein